MKKIQLFFLLCIYFPVFSQTSGSLSVRMITVTNPVSVVPNDIIQINHEFNWATFVNNSEVDYNVKYYLVDQFTNDTYLVKDIDKHIVNMGGVSNFQNEFYQNISPIEDIVVPCTIPSGQYWLKPQVSNLSYVALNWGDNLMFSISGWDVVGGFNSSVDMFPNNAKLTEVTLTNPNGLTGLDFVNTNSSCTTNNGTSTVNPIGGVGPFTYNWQDGQTSQTAINLAPGNYQVTVTDANGCSYSETRVIDLIYTLNLNATITNACTYDEGAIDINVTNGTGPYLFDWNNGETTSSIEGVPFGNYSVSVQDANGCTGSGAYNLYVTTGSGYFEYPNGLVIDQANPNPVLVDNVAPYGIIRIRGPLVIKDGLNYTINNKTIEFARDLNPEIPDQGATHSGIIVEPKSKLTATNCVFKGVSTCDAMWQGIQVWGDDYKISKEKPLMPIASLKHGELVLTNSTVRDAHIGVALYRVNAPFISGALDHGRGIVKAKFSNFLNNRVSVDFKGRSLVTNNSYIKECSFNCNEPMIDPFKYNGEGSDVYIRLSKVKNPVFNGNTFNGNLAFAIDKRATGIRSYDAGYIVQSGNAGPVNPTTPPVPNTFTNLSQGVDVYSTGGAVSTVRIKDNRFNNVYQGITANGSNFDEISFNVFNTPMGDIDFNSWGMFLQTSSGFLATENTLNTTGTNQYTFGIVNKNVNLIMGDLYKNTFNGSYNSATQAEGTSNSKLQIDCNRYNGSNTYDWSIISGSLAHQGECDAANSTLQVTNIFGQCLTSDESQIFSSANFNYSSDPGFAPICKSTTINNILCSPGGGFENLCPQYPGIALPCPSCVAGLQQDLNNTPPGLGRDKIKGELIRSLAQEGNVQDLVTILTSEALPEDMKIVIPTHIQRKEFSQARVLLNNLDQSNFENQKYFELFDVLTFIGETDRELDQIYGSEKLVIENIANSGTHVSTQAQAILAELSKSYYIRFPEMIPANSAMIISSNENTREAVIDLKSFTVYPNPGEGDVTIEFSELQQASGQLIDAMGRSIRTLHFDGNSSKYELNNIAQGIYTLAIQYVNGTLETQRVVIK